MQSVEECNSMSISVVPSDDSSVDIARTRVLLVDDSAVARRQVREALASCNGMHVTEACEGQEALWKAKSGRFDLVITDVHMPTMDGLAFIRQVRLLPAYATVPILVLTSDLCRERLDEGRAAGATGWLIKPPRADALVMTVRRALFERR
jgi:two-component system chemotaxis response regulator CheY